MADFTRDVKKILSDNNCRFVRFGKGDHEIWYSPVTDKSITVDGSIKKRSSAVKTLRKAGIKTLL